MDDCKGLIGRLLGHNFLPVYDTERKFPEGDIKVNGDPANAMERKSVYVAHICTRCGAEVRRPPA